jgi:hypothetical protein
MALTYQAIATTVLPNNSFSNILFANIPQTYTDLAVICSIRSQRNANFDSLLAKFNNAYNENFRTLQGRGTQIFTFAGTDVVFLGTANGATSTASNYSNTILYIANYTSTNAKAWFSDSVGERSATGAESAYQDWAAGISNLSTGITSIDIYAENAPLVQYSSATLYGIKNS